MAAWKRYALVVALLAGLFLWPVVISGSFRHNMMALMAANAIAALGLNLLTGISGQISLGHGGFMTIGAYTTAVLTVKAQLPMWVGMLAAFVVTAGVGFLLGLPALRLHGHFLALATLSFGAAVPEIAMKWTAVTGGAMGLSPPAFANDRVAYWVTLAVGAALVWVAYNLVYTLPGRALRALRDSDVAAQSMGVNLAVAKTTIFAISAGYGGVAGALTTHITGFMYPDVFPMLKSVEVLAMAVVGGLGSIPGSIYGAVLLTWLPLEFSRTKGWTSVIEGLAISLVVIFLPHGIASLWQRLQEVRRRVA